MREKEGKLREKEGKLREKEGGKKWKSGKGHQDDRQWRWWSMLFLIIIVPLSSFGNCLSLQSLLSLPSLFKLIHLLFEITNSWDDSTWRRFELQIKVFSTLLLSPSYLSVNANLFLFSKIKPVIRISSLSLSQIFSPPSFLPFFLLSPDKLMMTHDFTICDNVWV